MNTIYKLFIPFVILLVTGCEEIVPDLKRNNPNDMRDGEGRLTISEVNILDGSGRLTIAKPGSTVYISVLIIHYGQSGTVIKNVKGIFNAEDIKYLKNVVPTFGTPVSFYSSIANQNTDLPLGQTAYAVAFPQSYSSYAFRTDISSDAIRGEQIKFTVELTDDNNRRWNEDFKILID